jgi:hypothetical protein
VKDRVPDPDPDRHQGDANPQRWCCLCGDHGLFSLVRIRYVFLLAAPFRRLFLLAVRLRRLVLIG